MAKRKRSKSKRQQIERRLGTTPGTIIYTGDYNDKDPVVTLLDYNQAEVEEMLVNSLPETLDKLNGDSVSWLNLDGIHSPKLLEELGKLLKIHPLMLEDIANVDHLPKIENFEKHLFLTLKMISTNPETKEIQIEHLSFILGDKYIISFQEHEGDIFNPIRERINLAAGRVRNRKADYLFYLLLDAVIDNYYLVLDDLKEKSYNLEERLIEEPQIDRIAEIFELKRQVASIRKLIFPLRDSISRLIRDESSLIETSTMRYFNDVLDHMNDVSEIFEDLRELLGSMNDLNMANVSNNMNNVMKVLTIIATIFIPLTFIAGLYGMNFEYMPELQYRYSYFIALGVMGLLGIGTFIYVKRKGWL